MQKEIRKKICATAIFLVFAGIAPANGQEQGNTDVALAKKPANPIASLVSVPIQFNYDQDMAPEMETKHLSTSSR